MFKDMRRFRQLLPKEETIEILKKNTSGVLALLGEDGYPYSVPLNYVYDNNKIYFHGSKAGHKIDAIKNCDKASFCIIDKDDIVKEEYTSYFKSIIAFGKINIVEDKKEILDAINLLSIRYFPEDTKEHRDMVIQKQLYPLCIMRFDIEHITGKEAIELTKMRNH